MQFNNVIGQADVKEQLVQMVQNNRLSHALLFLGKDGSGGLSLAMAFAQFIVCNPKQPEAGLFGESDSTTIFNKFHAKDSCGVCPACIKAQKLIHPDIHFSYPVITKKSGEKPVSTDFISEWREFATLYPYG